MNTSHISRQANAIILFFPHHVCLQSIAVNMSASFTMIKQEPDDDGPKYCPLNFDTMSLGDIAHSLSYFTGGSVRVCQATERDMFTSCCGEKFVTETADIEPGERLLTTYRYKSGGPPTSFNVFGRKPSTLSQAQCSAKFFHADRPSCREAAISDTSDLHMVYCRRKPTFPNMSRPCDTCDRFEVADGLRRSTQVEIQTADSNSTHVFCPEDTCLRYWVKNVADTRGDTKSLVDEKVTLLKANMGHQFQMASLTSVAQICANTDMTKKAATERLLDVTGTDRERAWL